MNDNVSNIILERINRMEEAVFSKLAKIDTDLNAVKENTRRIEIRLQTVEAHMTGFMSSARYLETEIDALRGRVEALEQHIRPRD